MREHAGRRELVHVAFEAGEPACHLDRARLGDQQRLGILLQGAALVAHLEHGGWHLGSGLADEAWDEAEIDPAGVLKMPPPREGRSADLPQTFLLRLLQRLFRTDGEIAGRSPARRVARHLWGQWRQTLAPVPPDLAVRQILDSAEVLWQPSFARARHALAAEHRSGARRQLWIAGSGPARQRFLAVAASLGDLQRRLGSAEALDLWDGVEAGDDPRRAFEAGCWRKAATLWRRKRHRRDGLDYARSLLALGRSSTALEVLGRRKSPEAAVLRLWCLLHQGEGHAARKSLRKLEAALDNGASEDGEEADRPTDG
ncbi:MAG: hypothetical protein MI919_23110, partial [Holophagales bacterium]|nr:hypothetical protein [Holophagales bacterium]